jgi:Tol biopolymer transport system component
MRSAITTLVLCSFTLVLPGGSAALAQTPPGIDWRSIESPHFEIVFPKGLDADAERAVNALEGFYSPMSVSFGVQPGRVTVRLENQAPIHDIGGYVNLAPLRSVWNTARPQVSMGTNEWNTALAAHEGRHLIQFRAIDRGLPHGAKVLLGDTGIGLFLAWSMPYWWLEGDATVAESAFTAGGQARLAVFGQLMRTEVLSGRRFSYMKAMHGSYNDLLPDPYELGAHMVSRVNRSSGRTAWDGIIRAWAGRAWNPFALSSAMKTVTGRPVAATYGDMVNELDELLTTKAANLSYTTFRVLNRGRRTAWTSYTRAAYSPDGTVLAHKVGWGDAPAAVVRVGSDGTETPLFHYSPLNARITVAKGRMVWDEYVPDPRWNRGYSELVVRDLAAGRTTRLTHRTRLENPALSPDGSRIAAVEYSAAGRCSIVILDAATGAEVTRAGTPDNDVLIGPDWDGDNRRIALVRQTGSGTKALAVLDVATGAFTDLIPPSHEDLAAAEFAGDFVLYTSSLTGITNVYAVHRVTGRRYQVTSSRFGAEFPHASPDGTRLLFSDYTADGYDLAEMALDPASWQVVEAVPDAGIDYHETGARDYSADIPATRYQSRPYRPFAHLFSVNRWGIVAPPPAVGSLGVQANDAMGLLDSTAAVKYDTNERTWGYQLGATFRAYYPMLDLSFDRQRREARYETGTRGWNETATAAGFHIPFNLSRGIYGTTVTLGSGIDYRWLEAGGFASLNYWLSASHLRSSAARDAGPAWGQTAYLGYRHTPWNGAYHGDLLTASAAVFVPSPVKHHRIRLEAGTEKRTDSTYSFSSQMVFARGYDAVAARNLWRTSANYTLPLSFPDLALGQVAYIKKITGNVFFDYTNADQKLYRSAGGEAVFEMHLFSMRQAIRLGVRYAYLVDQHRSSVGPFLQFGW